MLQVVLLLHDTDHNPPFQTESLYRLIEKPHSAQMRILGGTLGPNVQASCINELGWKLGKTEQKKNNRFVVQ
jgi:hypothetical protein